MADKIKKEVVINPEIASDVLAKVTAEHIERYKKVYKGDICKLITLVMLDFGSDIMAELFINKDNKTAEEKKPTKTSFKINIE